MSRLERLIAYVSPRMAAKRAAYRASLDLARAYDAAKTGRRTDSWVVGTGSANAEIAAGASRIRARARDLVRNNPWAAAAVRKLATKVIGTGITPRPVTEDPRLRSAIMSAWQGFVDQSDPEGQQDWNGQCSLGGRTLYEAGEVLFRFWPRPASWGLKVPLQVQVLEPDWIDSSVHRALDNGGAIINGVEFDAFGRRTAYWLFQQHPGDLSVFTRRGLASQRVEAGYVLHCFDPQRPGQVRGISLFAPVILKMRDADDLDDAELMRRKVAACFAAFVKRGAGAAAAPLAGNRATTDTAGRRIEDLAPGMVQYLDAGDDIEFADPPAVEGYLDVMTHQLHAIAAGLGMTYELLTGDLSRVNYSSFRGGLIDFHDLLDQQQWNVVIPQVCAPTWRRVAALAGVRGLEGDWAATWATPRRRWVDPAKEIEAITKGIRSGLVTLDEAIAEQGWDPIERFREMVAINRRLDEAGLVLDSDPRRAAGKGEAPAAEPEPPPPAKAKKGK